MIVPRFGFLFVKDNADDFAKAGICPLIILFQSVFQFRNGGGYSLKKNCCRFGMFFSFHRAFFVEFLDS